MKKKQTRLVRIVIAHQQKMLREAMCELFGHRSDINVVGESGTGSETIDMLSSLAPDLVVMGTEFPDRHGLSVVQKIKSEHPEVKTMILTHRVDGHLVEDMMQAGALGYVLEKCSFNELIEAIHRINLGGLYVSREFDELTIQHDFMGLSGRSRNGTQKLTLREKDVLRLISDGFEPRQIASKLQITNNSVSNCRKAIMDKLRVDTVAQFTRYAIRSGLVGIN